MRESRQWAGSRRGVGELGAGGARLGASSAFDGKSAEDGAPDEVLGLDPETGCLGPGR